MRSLPSLCYVITPWPRLPAICRSVGVKSEPIIGQG